MKTNFKATVRDFDPAKDLSPENYKAYKAGFNEAVMLFTKRAISDQWNKELEMEHGEDLKQYARRIKDLCVELMCSNRGYASCFKEDRIKQLEERMQQFYDDDNFRGLNENERILRIAVESEYATLAKRKFTPVYNCPA